ncbi:nuclear transport factor 2 family protein [Pantoea sp. Tr-811]|uniref:nuclear transport factor 2 family protein n=1 Tax=Pantoea sp. Tr-811 TaxID=2608361 RepID=UPI001424168F|nr:nuclear transport factor 2 family protein [Pantoea sp. Tr-811]NIF29060.1 nuclear transport factor 2 family protein [Pantoea sp. Tr-811]
MTAYLQHFTERFTTLGAHNLDLLADLYSEDVTFRDPLHHISGLAALRAYFAQLYANVAEVRYTFEGLDEPQPGLGYIRWSLHYRHPRLAAGKLISLQGCSHLRWRERVHFHQDYFDAGALLYEHIPLMGGAIRWLKGRLA